MESWQSMTFWKQWNKTHFHDKDHELTAVLLVLRHDNEYDLLFFQALRYPDEFIKENNEFFNKWAPIAESPIMKYYIQ